MQNQHDTSERQPALARTAEDNASERDILLGEFVDEVKVLLGSIEHMCASLHAIEVDHWTPDQRRAIELVETAIHDALAIVAAQGSRNPQERLQFDGYARDI